MNNKTVLDKIILIVETLNELDSYHDMLPTQLSEIDKKLSDLYHYIESNQSINAKVSYRLIKELKSVLDERRFIKTELSILSTFIANKDRLNLPNNRQMLMKNVYKTQKDITQDYKYRVYAEEDLKEKLEK